MAPLPREIGCSKIKESAKLTPPALWICKWSDSFTEVQSPPLPLVSCGKVQGPMHFPSCNCSHAAGVPQVSNLTTFVSYQIWGDPCWSLGIMWHHGAHVTAGASELCGLLCLNPPESSGVLYNFLLAVILRSFIHPISSRDTGLSWQLM